MTKKPTTKRPKKSIAKAKPKTPPPGLKLDLGCGPNKRQGFLGVDIEKFPGVDLVHDLRKIPWPWKDNSVEEVNCSHLLEHFGGEERVLFFNELYRVLRVGGKVTITTPHWSSGRAYGDPTHKWPPVVEFGWFYLNEEWRLVNAPHVGYECNFQVTWSYNISPEFAARNTETQAFGVAHYREVAQDMVATLTKAERFGQ